MSGQDKRSAAAKRYRRLYRLARWARYDDAGNLVGGLKFEVHKRDRWTCQMCGRRDPPRIVADHIWDHKGNPKLFWDIRNVQSLCATPCHDRHKQSREARGYSTAIGPEGWPVDPDHPANRGEGRFPWPAGPGTGGGH